MSKTGKEIKLEIRERLKRYRDTNGLGCLEAVAKACRFKTITSMVLRDILLGTATLEMKVWLKIDRALDKLEKTVADTSKQEEKDG